MNFPAPWQKRPRRRGQTMIFIVVVIVILLFLALWNFDFQKIIFVKSISRNAGEIAALAGARWQGVSLNLIGNLNVLQAVAISDALLDPVPDFSEAEVIADLQGRVAFAGPMIGLLAAQQAAKNNRIHSNDTATYEMQRHATEVAEEYSLRYPGVPWGSLSDSPNAWQEYALMIRAVADQGVAAHPANRRFYADYQNSGHLLLNPSFYDAVATADWCWFFFNALDVLNSYNSYQDWPDLPFYVQPQPASSEYFGLGIRRLSTLESLPAPGGGAGNTAALISELSALAGEPVSMLVAEVPATWYAYRDDVWTSWEDLIPENFPFLGDIRPQYNYAGADAAIAIKAVADRLSPGAAEQAVTWQAAAKPFGNLDGPRLPNHYGLVLPAFTDVRLIPVDTSSAPASGSHPCWGEHIYVQLPIYVQNGQLDLSCWYSRQLQLWDMFEFRQAGREWLDQFSSSCYQPPPGGGGGGGGSRTPY